MKRNIILFCVFIIIVGTGFSQKAMELKIQRIDSEKYSKGDLIHVGIISTKKIDSIGAFQLYIEFDRSVLKYQGIKNLKEILSSEWMDNESECCYAANWLTLNPAGLSLDAGEKVFDLEFIYNGGSTDLTWQKKQKIEGGRLVNGETLFFSVKSLPIPLELINGCVCPAQDK